MRNFKKVYVGNLNLKTEEPALEKAFGEFGNLEQVSLVRDKETGDSRGFAFITFQHSEDAIWALDELNGSSLEGSFITVNEAFEKSRSSRKSMSNSRGHEKFFDRHNEDPLEKALYEAQTALDKAYSLYRDRKRR